MFVFATANNNKQTSDVLNLLLAMIVMSLNTCLCI